VYNTFVNVYDSLLFKVSRTNFLKDISSMICGVVSMPNDVEAILLLPDIYVMFGFVNIQKHKRANALQ